MDQIYFYLVIILFILAISDLIIGVTNDAVNFLNVGVGTKAGSLKLVLATAALGILVGVLFSNGMMEVARKGIFHPEMFQFQEIMFIFLAVMITDVLLLDIFNTFGLPTSTTVSIVFELLGAAVGMAVIKSWGTNEDIGAYINSGKALLMISGILLSVVVAFSVGALIQWLTRLLFTFDYKNKLKYYGALWGGFAFASLTYFLLIKGIKGAAFMDKEIKHMITHNAIQILIVSFVGWAVILQLLQMFTKFNILKAVVIVGTFALGMAFSGNDLVNFIGVPLAGYDAWDTFSHSGMDKTMMMESLMGKKQANTFLLLGAGLIMVITIWRSKKARVVLKTSLDLSRQDDGEERFTPSSFTKGVVRTATKINNVIIKIFPESTRNWIGHRFNDKPFLDECKTLGDEAPVFDMVRGASTLVVASILISIGTSYKLPLSTTYVTFMTAMGTSLADGAWGRESAVYRISGVFSVVGGWFLTAFSAFSVAFIFVSLFHFGGIPMVFVLVAIAAYAIFRTHVHHNEIQEEKKEMIDDVITTQNLTSKILVEKTINKSNELLSFTSNTLKRAIDALEKEDFSKLKSIFKDVKKMQVKTRKYKTDIPKIIDKLDEGAQESGFQYLKLLDSLRLISNGAFYFVLPAYQHTDNNHKPLLPVQIDELNKISNALAKFMEHTNHNIHKGQPFENDSINAQREELLMMIRSTRKNQIKRIKNKEVGTKNSMLYFALLNELRNITIANTSLPKLYNDFMVAAESE